MSEIAPVTEPVIETPVEPDFGAMQSIDEYRAARDSAETPVETPAEPVEAKAEVEQPEAQPDPASEAGKALAAKKNTMQARIDRLTREKYETKAEADAARAEAQALRAEIAALKTPRPAAAPPSAQPETTTPQFFTRPKPVSNDPRYETYEDYLEDLTDWKNDERDAAKAAKDASERQASSEQEAIRVFHAAQDELFAKGREAHADFDATLEQAANEIKWSPLLTQAVLSSENSHDVAYALAKDSDTAKRLSAIEHPVQAALEIGKVLARLGTVKSGSVPVVAPVTQAPDPIKPVGGTSAGASTADPKNMTSVAAWREARKAYL